MFESNKVNNKYVILRNITPSQLSIIRKLRSQNIPEITSELNIKFHCLKLVG